MEKEGSSRDGLIAELNDLLRLDHDAVQSYGIAIEHLDAAAHQEKLREFRADHERHIEQLSGLIRQQGGKPVGGPHLTTGAVKAAVQQAGRAGGDRGILTAFKTNERQARDKYRRHAEKGHAGEVGDVVARGAADEERHYAWVVSVLESIEGSDAARRATDTMEVGQARAADAMEAAERKAGEAAEKLGRSR